MSELLLRYTRRRFSTACPLTDIGQQHEATHAQTLATILTDSGYKAVPPCTVGILGARTEQGSNGSL